MALPPRIYNRSTNPSFETALAASVIRTNNFANPAFETGTTGVAAAYGTTGAGAISRPTTGGMQGPAHARMQWTTASTVVGGYMENAAGTLPTGTHTLSTWVRVNRAAQRLQLVISQSSGAFTTVSNPAVDVTINTWTRISATINVTTAGVMVARATAVAGGNGRVWAIADQLDTDGWLADLNTSALNGYFDGASTAANGRTYAWTGTAHGSTSTESVLPVKNFAGAAGQTLNYQSTATPDLGTAFARCEVLTTAAIGLNPQDGFMADATTRTAILRVRPSRALTVQPRWRNTDGTAMVNEGGTVALTANVWNEVRFSGTPAVGAATAPSLLFNSAQHQVGDYIDIDRHMVTEGVYTGDYFDGDGGAPGWSDLWSGTAHDSYSYRDATGLWVDVDLTGTAHTVLTVLGLGPAQSLTKIVRTEGKAAWPVPGWLGRRTIDADTGTDWTVPLGRPVTYTLFKDGIAIASRTVTVAAATGDIMDPLNPPGALKVNTTDLDPNVLTLSNASMTEIEHANTAGDREYPLGARYPISRPGVRSAAGKIPFTLNAATNQASDALLDVVEDAPILLIRSLPSWGSVPALVYTDATVTEVPLNRGRGGQFTRWSLEADAVAPVTRATTAGRVTNDEVKANLTGRTHDSIKAASGTKRHVEIKANPLSLGQ